jgi:integrase
MKKNPAASADPADRAQLEFKETVLCRGSGIAEVVERAVSKNRATVRQKKTGQPVKFEMTEQTREAIDNYLAAAGKKPGEFIFGGRRGRDRPITTRQYARLVGQWIAGIGLDPRFFGTHSLRRTKATLIYRRTGNLRAVQLLLGH